MTEQTLAGMRKVGSLLALTPLGGQLEPCVMLAAEMLACFAMQSLRHGAPQIFPGISKTPSKYMLMIPLALIVSAELHGWPLSASSLYEMMVLSMLNFQVDTYMEQVVEGQYGHSLHEICELIEAIFIQRLAGLENVVAVNGHGDPKAPEKPTDAQTNGNDADQNAKQPDTSDTVATLRDIQNVLGAFVVQILGHPAVKSSPLHLQEQLASELKAFLLAHVSQAQDNRRFNSQYRADQDTNAVANGIPTHETLCKYSNPGKTFYSWVRSTFAVHTSCVFSFVFFNCLVHTDPNGKSESGTTSARVAYLSEDVCRHLASLCRMYNDLGSLNRDVKQGNLNSVNFPEFFFRTNQNDLTTEMNQNAKDDAKSELLWIAEYERRSLAHAVEALGDELSHNTIWTSIKMFVDLTDLYGKFI